MTDIQDYNAGLPPSEQEICDLLASQIAKLLPDALGKVWHGHPVWFLGENPVVGYSLKKSGIELLFWSGQSFSEPGLKSVGKFKAAGISITSQKSLVELPVATWINECQAIQWDYANLAKKRVLEKLTDF